jgi:putative Ca2+/H+ antiporter (TMEM165/GDT1 family)
MRTKPQTKSHRPAPAVAIIGPMTFVKEQAPLHARDHDPLAVGTGAVLGLRAVGVLTIVGGRQPLRIVPFRWITPVAAVVMAGLAAVSLIAAITG